MTPNAPSVLAGIVDRPGPLPARCAVHGSQLQAATIHVAVPDRLAGGWTADALLSARDKEIGDALAVASRSLQEKVALPRRQAMPAGSGILARRYIELADEAEHAITVLGARLPKADSGSGKRVCSGVGERGG